MLLSLGQSIVRDMAFAENREAWVWVVSGQVGVFCCIWVVLTGRGRCSREQGSEKIYRFTYACETLFYRAFVGVAEWFIFEPDRTQRIIP